MKFNLERTSSRETVQETEIKTLEELLHFVSLNGERIVIQPTILPKPSEPFWTIEIYDDFRE